MSEGSLDVVTKVSTLQTGQRLVQVASGTAATVLGSPNWVAVRDGLTPTSDVENALLKAGQLGSEPLEKCARMKWVTFPMKGRSGVFEIRVRGIRFYGGRIAKVGGSDVLVLLGAEQKAGNLQADTNVLDGVERELTRLQKVWSELPDQDSKPGGQLVHLHDHPRRKR